MSINSTGTAKSQQPKVETSTTSTTSNTSNTLNITRTSRGKSVGTVGVVGSRGPTKRLTTKATKDILGVVGSENAPLLSPRTSYLEGCFRENLNPRASLILRKNLTKILNLQHHSIGDKMGIMLAEALVQY